MLLIRLFEIILDFFFVLSVCDFGENDIDDFLFFFVFIISLRRRIIIKLINICS